MRTRTVVWYPSIQDVINTGLFSMEKAQQSPGWLQELRDGVTHVPETLEYGVSSFLYRRHRWAHTPWSRPTADQSRVWAKLWGNVDGAWMI